jgi:serine protease AprX
MDLARDSFTHKIIKMKRPAYLLIIILISLSAVIFPGSTSSSNLLWQSRVDPWILENAQAGKTEFIIFLSQQADLSGAAWLSTKQEKTKYVYETLRKLAEKSQKPILDQLTTLVGVDYQSFWIANMIWASGDLSDIQAIASMKEVAHLYANPKVRLEEPDNFVKAEPQTPSLGLEWNIHQVNADAVWAAGFTGQGVVIGGADTGYDWTHPALKNQYRGWD